MKPAWIHAARYAGLELDASQVARMSQYGDWLSSEAARAGGIGPAEVGRIDLRHLADSVLFASQFPHTVEEIWDLGSGVGLPGIPLAICLPGTSFRLIDRSGRRCDLLRRALRILELNNCEVRRTDIASLQGQTEGIVSRASLPPDQLLGVARRRLSRDGIAVAAGSWQSRPQFEGWDTVEIPPHVLDHTVWLLIMRRE